MTRPHDGEATPLTGAYYSTGSGQIEDEPSLGGAGRSTRDLFSPFASRCSIGRTAQRVRSGWALRIRAAGAQPEGITASPNGRNQNTKRMRSVSSIFSGHVATPRALMRAAEETMG